MKRYPRSRRKTSSASSSRSHKRTLTENAKRSAASIVDILQRLVMDRPELIIALELIARALLAKDE